MFLEAMQWDISSNLNAQQKEWGQINYIYTRDYKTAIKILCKNFYDIGEGLRHNVKDTKLSM